MEIDLKFDQLDLTRYLSYTAVMVASQDALFFPLELMKTRLQVQGMQGHTSSCPPYGGFFNAVRSIYRLEGIRGFYKGLTPSLAFIVPTELLYLSTYEYTRHWLLQHAGSSSPVSTQDNRLVTCDFIAGGLGDVVSGVIWVPADLASQRLQVQGPHTAQHLYKSAPDVIRQILQHQGIRGLYVGYVPALLTNVPYSALLFSFYQQTKRSLLRSGFFQSTQSVYIDNGGAGVVSEEHERKRRRRGRRKERKVGEENADDSETPEENSGGSHFVNLISGCIAGSSAAFLTNPLDVARVRMQVQGHNRDLLGHTRDLGPEAASSPMRSPPPPPPPQPTLTPVYRNVWHTLSKISRQEGIRALWSGAAVRASQCGFGAAVGLLLYDAVKSFAKLHSE